MQENPEVMCYEGKMYYLYQENQLLQLYFYKCLEVETKVILEDVFMSFDYSNDHCSLIKCF